MYSVRTSLKKSFAVAAMIGVLGAPSFVMAAQIDCAAALKNCYSKWYMPNWGCDKLAADCYANQK